MTKVRYDPSGNYVAAGSLGSQVKIWDAKALKVCATLMGHQERITALAWHPQAHLSALATLESRDQEGSEGAQKTTKMPKKRNRSPSYEENQGQVGSSAPDASYGQGKALLASSSADADALTGTSTHCGAEGLEARTSTGCGDPNTCSPLSSTTSM